jgi:TonB family protein
VACNQPDHDVTLVRTASTQYPDSARDLGLGPLTAIVVVTVDANGTVTSATISKSSGNGAVDRAAITAARLSAYAPQLVSCVATGGIFAFNAQFDPGSSATQGILGIPGLLPPYQSASTCAIANREATVIHQAAADPDLARREDVYSVVLVEVTIGPKGDLVSAAIYTSSENAAVDRAAIVAAKQSTYAPKLVNCTPVTGDYLFRILFKPN